MGLVEKIFKIVAVVFLALNLFSCDQGCVEIDQFDTEYSIVDSYPVTDGVYGTYNSSEGGQRAQWHNTGLRTNGDPINLQITGSWTSWYGGDMSATTMSQLPVCRMCAKSKTKSKSGSNCLCNPGEVSKADINELGKPSGSKCDNFAEQNDPNKCTCTTDPEQGYNNDLTSNQRHREGDVYYFPLDSLNKNGAPKEADKQDSCRYDKGMGLYIGLFGSNGAVTPKRVYHLYSLDKHCAISTSGSNAPCVDANGNDRTFYVYKSPNNTIFVKDDHNGNSGADSDTSNDEYHKKNEQVKLMIYDKYYADNFGTYNVTFLGGTGSADKRGLLEFIVNMFEDVVLGPINDDGEREGGVIKFMYKAIVQDSGFIAAVQILLALYISIYGLATLFGVAELNKKELTSRLIKIALVIMFTSKDGWNMYNDLVVRFFKDGMDYVISIMMSLTDAGREVDSTVEVANHATKSTRFAYADLMIKKLLSDAVAKKTFGLFFGTYFGIIYIPIIYALIAFFIYVMLFIGMIYLTNVLKIIFVLSLGPIFICFTLFSHTNQMFKNWLTFIAARSLEIVLLFTVLFNFLFLIDQKFSNLFAFRTCMEGLTIAGYTILGVMRSYVPTHSPIYWFSSFLIIAGFIFITKLIALKVADISGHLIEIGGVGNKDSTSDVGHGASGFSMASQMAGEIGGAIKDGVAKAGKFAGRHGVNLATAAARKSGLAESWNALGKKIPFRGVRSRMRDSKIDSAIKSAQADGISKGYTGKSLDAHVRAETVKAIGKFMQHNPNETAAKGMNMTAVAERLDKVLLEKPLKAFLKQKAKELKSQTDSSKFLMGKDLRQALRQSARNWADNNTNVGAQALDRFFGEGKDVKSSRSQIERESGDRGMRNLVRSLAEVSPELAAKKLYGNAAAQAEYQKSLDEKDYRKDKLDRRANSTYFGQAVNNVKNALKAATRSTKHDTDIARKSFARGLRKQEGRGNGILDKLGINTAKGFNPISRIKALDRVLEGRKGDLYSVDADKMRAQSLRDRLQNRSVDPNSPGAARKANGEILSKERREFFGNQLKGLARKPVKALVEKAKKRFDEIIEDRKKREEVARSAGAKDGAFMWLREQETKEIATVKEELNKQVLELTKDRDLTLAEKKEMLLELNKSGLVKVDAIIATIDAEINKKSEEKTREFEKESASDKYTGAAGAQKLEELKAIQQGFIATDFKVEFGSSIADVLLKSSDIGLRAGNVLLGVSETDADVRDRYVQKAQVESKKHQAETMGRMVKLNKKINEAEITALNGKIASGTATDEDRSKIAILNRELAELSKDETRYDREIESWKQEITTFGNLTTNP